MLNISNELLMKFCNFIYENSGIKFDEKNKIVLKGRINDAIHELENINTPKQLYELITFDKFKKEYFLDLVTTNLTRFFRNETHFATFEKFIIPNLINIKTKEGKNRVIIWSAGCSTGEEPYSLAFVLKSHLPKNFDFIIIASDLSLKSLMIAKEGYYSVQKCEHIPIQYKQYIKPKMDGYKVIDDIKKHIRFDYHNLNFESGFSNIDVVFCRNVLIYFDEKSKIKVLKKFYSSMAAKSYLFIGHSESLFGLNLPFKFLRTPWAIIYEKDNHSA
ncbi:protein-glutamate O-methyltransferase [Borrelia anserina]|uniref:protein-glutamate O-methyltransferase n=2 Tax=Borrelia anserina TaxID=143 RepID=W5SNB6_BORAN|nr:protein-glutamate O-methyltransferase [Borrelia anserina]AHH08387.1 Chemotaxis protein methyltransferase [Borrelia anserina BA2]APR64874.1 chemotaxis protein CheR [Borrelia anserina Es]UPA06795.1 protein-glutamate O-methyltransferase [Borrelia anserina]